MNITQIKKITPPANPSIDISFGENIHATAIYSIDYITYEEGEPELICLMAPVGKNGSSIDIKDDLHPETVYKAWIALRDALEEASDDAKLERQISKWERR